MTDPLDALLSELWPPSPCRPHARPSEELRPTVPRSRYSARSSGSFLGDDTVGFPVASDGCSLGRA